MVTAWQGLDATTQTCPTAAFPPEIPFTCHVILVFALPEITAEKVCRCETASVELAGPSVTDSELVRVTVAWPEMFELAVLVA